MSPRKLSLVEWHMVAQLAHNAQSALRNAADVIHRRKNLGLRVTTEPFVASDYDEPTSAMMLRELARQIAVLCDGTLSALYVEQHPEDHCHRLVDPQPCPHSQLCSMPMEPGAPGKSTVCERDPRGSVAAIYTEAIKQCMNEHGTFSPGADVMVTEYGPVLESMVARYEPAAVPTLEDLATELVRIAWNGSTTAFRFCVMTSGHIHRQIAFLCMIETGNKEPWIIASRHPPWAWIHADSLHRGLVAIRLDGDGEVHVKQIADANDVGFSSPDETFVDSEKGDDSAAGTRQAPIKTFREWNRRIEARRDRGNTP